MKTKLTIRELFAVGSLLFGLFFGAGNLIFPVHMGQQAGSQSLVAVLGFIFTGVGLPLLGIAAMAASQSEGLLDMASRVGKRYARFFTCALYLTIGPFFAIPRCATTSFTVGLEPMVGLENARLCLLAFSAVFFAAVLLFSLRPSGILTWVGRIINPVFLALLGILIIVSFMNPMADIAAVAPDATYASGALFHGFLEGYNTMDALAALAFGITIIQVIRDLGLREPKAVAAGTFRAGVFSCLLMAVIYALTTFMGAKSRGIFAVSENGGIALAQIAGHYFGSAGQILLMLTVLLACLKTSIGLVTSCAEAFEQMFPKISYRAWAILFSLFPLLISNVGLTTLISWSLPVLRLLYPLAITLILLSLFGRLFRYDRAVFVSVTAFTFAAAFIDFLAQLPDALHMDEAIHALARCLPLSSIGLGWACPALAGLVIGLVIRGARAAKQR